MTTVTFASNIGGNGLIVTDDANPSTGLDGGGHRTRFVPALAQTVAVASFIVSKAEEAATSIASTTAAASAAAASASSASTSAAAASASAATAAAAVGSIAASLLAAFPVGAIYITAGNTSPASFLGGTWTQIAAGRTLIGVGTLGTDTYTAGQTGGEARHTLTVDEMPYHSHGGATGSGGAHNHGGATGAAGAHSHTETYRLPTGDSTGMDPLMAGLGSTTYTTGTTSTSSVTDHTHTIPSELAHNHTVTAEGGGATHENRMPFMAVYFWQRTA